MPYIGNSPGTGTRNRFIYTATASQTTFSGADDNGKTLKYADSDFVDVYLNGICLVPVTDYTSTSKTSVVLTQAASLNDTLEVIAYDIATIADTVSKADGGTFEDGVTIRTADNTTQLTLESTDADASVGPVLDLHRNSSSPADADTIGEIAFKGQNDADETLSYGFIKGFISDASDGTEDGQLNVNTMIGGTTRQRIKMDSTETVFNEEGRDIDFRVESDTHASAFLVDASTGGVEMNTAESNIGLFLHNTTHDSIFTIQTSGANKNSTIRLADGDDADVGMIDYDHNTNALATTVNASERTRITSDGVFQATQYGIGGTGTDTIGLMRTKNSSSGINFDFIVDIDTSSWTPLNFYITVGSINSNAVKPRSAYFVVRAATFNGSVGSIGVAGELGDTSDITVTISDQGGLDPTTVRVAIAGPNNRLTATCLAQAYLGAQRVD